MKRNRKKSVHRRTRRVLTIFFVISLAINPALSLVTLAAVGEGTKIEETWTGETPDAGVPVEKAGDGENLPQEMPDGAPGGVEASSEEAKDGENLPQETPDGAPGGVEASSEEAKDGEDLSQETPDGTPGDVEASSEEAGDREDLPQETPDGASEDVEASSEEAGDREDLPQETPDGASEDGEASSEEAVDGEDLPQETPDGASEDGEASSEEAVDGEDLSQETPGGAPEDVETSNMASAEQDGEAQASADQVKGIRTRKVKIAAARTGEAVTVTVEAEECSGLPAGNGDGNFDQVSGESALRNQGAEATISGRVVLGEAGNYYVRVYVGSREGNEGSDSISIDGGGSWRLIIPEKTAPGWYAAELRSDDGNPAGPLALAAGEHTFTITSRSSWCYYDKIEFSTEPAQTPEMPELTLFADRGTAANSNFTLGGAGLFQGGTSSAAALRLTGDNTFTYTLNIPAAGNYKITARTAGKDTNSGTANLTVNGTAYSVNVTASGVGSNIPLTETLVAENVALEAGPVTITLSTGTAYWCYFDSFTLTKEESGPDPGPDTPEEPFSTVEAENCTSSLPSGNGDGNFTTVSGGKALRNQGAEATISGRVVLEEAGNYYVRVYVGSRTDNSGSDSISIDGGPAYKLMVPAGTAPGWYEAGLRDEATGNPVGAISLEAGEHTFAITSRSAWCYYDKIEFSTEPTAEQVMPELTLFADRGTAANNQFELAASGLFADDLSDRTVLRLTGDNTFTYMLNVPETGNYKITARTAGKNGDSGAANLTINGTAYSVNVIASGVASNIPLMERTVADSVALEAGPVTVTLSTGTAYWCYFDSFALTRLEDGEDPSEKFFSTAEAEDCTFSANMRAGSGDGNFSQVSGGAAVRNWGAEGETISGRVVLEEAGNYYVRVYVGSRDGNAGHDSISVDGGAPQRLSVPEKTAPGWYAAEPRYADGKPIGPMALEAGEHTFVITSNAAWCYYDKIEFSTEPAQTPEMPELVLFADRGTAANDNYWLAASGIFAEDPSGGTALRLMGDNTFTYVLNVPEAGDYKITARTAGKNTDSGTAKLEINGETYAVNVSGSGVSEEIPFQDWTVADGVALEAGTVTITLSTGTAVWCYFDRFTFTKEEALPPEEGSLTLQALDGRMDLSDGSASSAAFEKLAGGDDRLYLRLHSAGPQEVTRINYSLRVPEDGNYKAIVRMGTIGQDSGRNTLVIDGTEYYFTVPVKENRSRAADIQWYELELTDRYGNPAGAIPMKAGRVSVQLVHQGGRGAEWCYLDSISFEPSDQAAAPVNTLRTEAEAGWFLNGKNSGGIYTTGDGNFQAAGGIAVRLWDAAEIEYKLTVPERGWYTPYAVVSSRADNSGRDRLRVGDTDYYLNIPAGIAPETMEIAGQTESGVDAPIWLEPGEYTLKLVYEGAAWCYYDTLELRKAEVPELNELRTAIDNMPSSDNIKPENKADFEKAYEEMKRYVYLAGLYGWEPLEDARQEKMILNEARLAALSADPEAPAGRYQYEWENGTPGGNTVVVGESGAMKGADGGSYIYLFDGSMAMYFYVPRAGRYHMYFKSASDNPQAWDKCDKVILNGDRNYLYTPGGHAGEWQTSRIGKERYINGTLAPYPPAGGYWLNAGWNGIVLQANWGYACYDSFYIEPADYYMYDGWYYPSEVEKLAEDLPAPDQVKLEDYARIRQTFQAYQSLDEDGKKQVSSQERILTAQARADALMYMPDAPEGTLWYGLEYSRFLGNTASGTDVTAYGGYTGAGYAYLFDGGMELEIYVPETRTYDIYIRSSGEAAGGKCDYVKVNGAEFLTAVPGGARQWHLTPVGLESYENGEVKCVMPVGGIPLQAGWNLVEISANWGYCAYDALVVMPGTGSSAFGGIPYSKDAVLQEAYIGPGWPAQESEAIAWKTMDRGETYMERKVREAMARSEDRQDGTGTLWKPEGEQKETAVDGKGVSWKVILAAVLGVAAVVAGLIAVMIFRKKQGGEEE